MEKIYYHINKLRNKARRELIADLSAKNHLLGTKFVEPAKLRALGPKDWHGPSSDYPRTLGDPEENFCVTIDDNDDVTVWVDGADLITETIPAASMLLAN